MGVTDNAPVLKQGQEVDDGMAANGDNAMATTRQLIDEISTFTDLLKRSGAWVTHVSAKMYWDDYDQEWVIKTKAWNGKETVFDRVKNERDAIAAFLRANA